MKQIFSTIAIAGLALMTACKTNGVSTEEQTALTAKQATIDSLRLEMAKKEVVDSMNEMNRMQFAIPAVAGTAMAATIIDEQPVARKRTTARKSTATTRKSTAARKNTIAKRSTPARRPSTRKPRSYESNSGGSSSTYDNGNSTVASNTPAPVYQEAPVVAPQKKGWSAKAKGAVIGTGVGAAAGAIINKRNRVAGAVIGGVLGAGAGTGLGAILDKRNGR